VAGTVSGLDARLKLSRGAFDLDVSLVVAAGETLALLGPNGSGKTSTVLALAGLAAIDEGHIELEGNILDDPGLGVFVPPDRRRIGVVFQDYALFPHLTVAANVGFAITSGNRRAPDAAERTAAWLQRLRLEDLADRKPGRLSGGESQRVALARALASEPSLLLLDEPLAALDVAIKAALRRELADHLAGFAGPRILITHDPTDAFLLADTIAIIEAGGVVQVGRADDLRRHPRSAYAADLAGVNLLAGTATRGDVVMESGPPMQIAETGVGGRVLLTIHPRAISLHVEPPSGSPRNAWQTSIVWIEPIGDRVRVQLGTPHPLTAEITEGSMTRMGLTVGSAVWVAIKATEIGVQPA
jgi:molybdate transport system ATP-binding protein